MAEEAPKTSDEVLAPEAAEAAVKETKAEAPAVKAEVKAEVKADEKPVKQKSLLDEEEVAPIVRRTRGKGGKFVPTGVVHVTSTFNNTTVTITDPRGNVVAWGNGGRSGFKGSRKSTAYAATVISQETARTAVSYGMQEVEVRVQGPGAGRESAIRALQSCGLSVTAIKDVTPIPHNGCRARKRRRV